MNIDHISTIKVNDQYILMSWDDGKYGSYFRLIDYKNIVSYADFVTLNGKSHPSILKDSSKERNIYRGYRSYLQGAEIADTYTVDYCAITYIASPAPTIGILCFLCCFYAVFIL